MGTASHEPRWLRVLRRICLAFLFVVVVLCSAWATLALYFDFPCASLRVPAAAVYVVALIAAFVLAHEPRWKLVVGAACFALVLVWWLSIKPSNNRTWQADVAQMPWAEFHGDAVTLHNF